MQRFYFQNFKIKHQQIKSEKHCQKDIKIEKVDILEL